MILIVNENSVDYVYKKFFDIYIFKYNFDLKSV